MPEMLDRHVFPCPDSIMRGPRLSCKNQMLPGLPKLERLTAGSASVWANRPACRHAGDPRRRRKETVIIPHTAFLPRDTNLINKAITPSFIVKYLDQYVIGQDDAKKTVAVTVYSHFKKIAKSQRDGTAITKSNVLLIGPSGTGKTLLCETLSQVLGVPFVTAEATALAQSRYINEEIEAVLQRLVDKAGGDVATSQNGIVFIDEIDKLKAIDGQPRSVSGESVQHRCSRSWKAPRSNWSTDDTSIRPISCSFAAGHS